ncbi:MAG: hypothetical protein AAF655_18000 [Bacteroidota bacterium]
MHISLHCFLLCTAGLLSSWQLGCSPTATDTEDSLSIEDSSMVEEVSTRALTKENPFPYKLEEPLSKVKLPKRLTEISGLSYVAPQEVVLVQDEKGKIYHYDLKNDSILHVHDFGKGGDYEGVETLGDQAFVLRSDGDVYHVDDWTVDSDDAEKVETILTDRNDTEGLGLLASQNLLLIACKAEPNYDGNSLSYKRAVYAYDIKKKRVIPQPFLVIDLKEIKKRMKQSALTRFAKDFASTFDPAGDRSFQPSGLAVHPLTGDFYIIATAGKLLVVLDEQKKIKYVQTLDEETFKQPEGICFGPDGTLFISNEGRGGRGNVLQFSYLAAE